MTNLSNDKQRSPTVLFKIAAQILLLAALLMGMNNAKAGHFSLSGVNAPATFNSAAHFTISVRFNIIPTVNLFNNAIQVTNGRLIGGPTGVNPRTFTIAPNLNGRDVTVTFPAGLFSSGTHAYASDIVRTVRYERPIATLGDLPANHNGVSPFMVTVTLSKPADDFDINDIELSANASGMLSGSGTDYTLTVMPDNTQGSITINILADGFTDALGVQNTISQGRLVAYGGQPFVALSGAPSSATGLTPFEVTAMFTQDVHRFDDAVGFTLLPIDITSIPVTVTNGMGRVKSHSGRAFVLEITPAGIGDSIDIFLPRNAVIYANFDGNPPSNVVRVPYTDTTPPMVTLGTPATINSLTFQVALNFSEAITRSSFTAVDVMTNINNGMVRVTGVDSNGADIVLIITHDGTVPSIVVSIPGRTFTDQAGNLNLPSSEAVLLYADDIRPDVTLSDLPDSHDGMTPFTVTVTVSEPVTSFVLSDFSAAPSASVTLTGSGTTYTATITPELNNTDDIEILVFESSFADATGNLNRGAQAVRIPYVAPDITPPTVMVRGPAAYESGRSVFIVRLTFSEAVSGVSAGTSPSEARGLKFQVDVDNGSASSAIKISDSIYDVDIVYFGDTTEDISITFLAGVAMDASGNTNTVSNTLVVPSDPPLTVDLATSAQTANAATAFTVTIFFSEDVTDFVLDDIVFNNASALTALQMTNASTYVVTVQADNMADVTITVPAGVAMAGTKTNMVSNTLMVPYDYAPTVVLAAAATSMTSPFTVTATFSERVSGFAVDDITIANGTVATVPAPVLMSDGTAAYTLTITPTAAGDVTLTIPAGAANDLDGTPTANTASNTLTVAYTLDVTPPTVAFIAPPANHDGTSPFTVMVRLSEPSTDFGSISISVSSNANITLSGSGTDYTLTVTPTDTNDIIISVLPGGFTDTIGNANMMASETLTVAYTTGDSTRPMATLTGPAAYQSSVASGFNVRLMFSEAVSGVSTGTGILDVLNRAAQYEISANGMINGATKISDSVYEVRMRPISSLITEDITIRFNAGFAMDADGNTNTASNTLVVPSDNIPPTVVFGGVPANHDGTTPFTVTVTLSEPAEDFIADDIELSDNASGTLSGSGADYRLTVTPTDTNSITIDIPADSFTDVATNGNTASETVTVTLADTTPPTVTLTGPDPANHDGTSAFMVTVTLSETATDFGAGDIDSSANATVTLTGSGSVYTLTITPTDTGSITIDIPAASFTDAATNPNTASETFTVTYVAPDITPPTVTLTGPDPATFSNTEPFVVTATFDEAVTGFDAFADSTVTNGTATDGQRLDATTYTLTIMPYDTTGDIEITIPAGVAMDAEGNGNTASDPLTMAYVAPDNIPPAVRLGTQDDTANASDTVLIMAVTFDEPVTGFDAATDIKVTGGTAIAPHRVTSTAYTLTITPTPMTEGTITIQIPANVATDTEGNGNTASNIGRVTYDGIAPTARLSGGGGSTTSFLDYSSVVLASTSSDIDHASFTPDEFVTTPESVVVTSAPNTDGLRVDTVFTITHDGTAEEITITIPIGSFTDLAGNPNTEAVILTTIYTPPDTTPPTVMLSGAPATVNASDTTFTVTATFSEPVTGFDSVGDTIVVNGTVAAPEPVGDSGTTYTLTIAPATDGEITITIPANVAVDAASNNNIASNEVSVTYDGTPPTISLTGNGQTFNTLTFTAVSVGGTSLDINHVSFTSDEWVTTPANVMVTSAPGMNGFRLATVYSIKHDGTASEITITAPIGSFTDNAGNPNTEAFTFTFTYVDVTPPTVTFTDPPANHSNSEFMVTVTLSEPTDDFVISDITFSDNASGALTGSGTDYTLTVTPTDTNSVTITIAGGTFTDAASLPNLFTETLTVAYASDAIRPTVMLTGPTVGNIEPFAVTATFSKPVTGFDAMADITVTNGTATMPVAVSNSETTYTLAITPAGTGDIGVTIPAAAAMDSTGNTNTASETLTVAIDTTRPTAMFSGVPANHDGMTPFTVTITLSELSNDFGEDDISVANANIALSGSGTDYSLTVTPTGTVTIAIGIATNRFTDAANNGNLLAASVFILYVDTTPPTAMFSGVPASHDGMTPFTVTITLSEPSTDFAEDDITQANADKTLSGSGTEYSLTITPLNTGDIGLGILPGSFTDGANNPNTASEILTIPYAAPVDTTPLTVTLFGPLTYGISGFTTVVRFSEDVPGLTIGAEGYTSFTITNATATEFTRRSGSIYDLIITPESGSTADISVTFNAGAATAGTKTNTVSNTLTIAHSTLPPVSLIGPDSLTHDGETVFTVAVDFSNDVGGFDTADDITISGGTTSAPVVSGIFGTFSRYTLTITPNGTADITISLNSGVAESGTGNTPTAASNVLTVFYAAPADTTPPTVMLTGPATTTELTFEITAVFSEQIIGFTADDINISTHATVELSGAATMTGGEVHQRLSVTHDGSENSVLVAILAGTLTDTSGNPNTASNQLIVVNAIPADTTPPTVMLTGAPTAVNASTTTFAVTATFSEAVTGFDAIADIAVDNGTAAAPVFVSEGIYTLTITPAGTDGAITITIPANVAADADANGNTASSAVTVTYDTTPPTVTFSGFPASHDGMTPFMVTVTLSEVATDFVVGDIGFTTNANRTLSGSGTDYIVTVTPRNTSPIGIAILADRFTDAAGNGNTLAAAAPIPYVAPADTPPVASVHIGTAGTQVGTIAEAGTTSTTVTVTLSAAAPPGEVTVLLTRSGSATIATDYSHPGLTAAADPLYVITVAAGATTASFMLTAVDDSVNDDGEAVVFTVTTGTIGTGYTPASGGAEAVTVTILDDDAPPVASVHIGTAGTQVGTIAEAGTTSTTVTVALNPAPTTLVTVFLNRSGSATIDTDYSQTGLSAAGDSRHIITLAAGATTGSFTLTAVDDSVNDDDETAVFTVVTTGTGYTPASGGAAAVTVTIMDDDSDNTPPSPVGDLVATPGNDQVALSWTNPSDTDLSTVIISAMITGGAVVDINGAGTAGNDLSISATPGTMVSQSITGLSNGTGYTFSLVASDGTNPSTPVTTTATPVVPPPEFSFPTTTATVAEGGSLIRVNIAFTGGALASNTNVNISLGGTAMAADYSTVNSGKAIYDGTTVAINAGITSPVSFFIEPAPDVLTEGDETLIITLLDGEGYTVGSQNTYTLTITDPPPPTPVASVHIGTAGTQVGTIAEAGTTSTMVTVSLSAAAPAGGVLVVLTRSGSATIATDYSHPGLTAAADPLYSIMVAAGATTASFMLTAVDDSVNDADEAAVFTVTTGTGYTVAAGGAAAVTVTIMDDSDTTAPTVTLSGPSTHNGNSFNVLVTFSEDVTGLATGLTGIASLQSYITVTNANAIQIDRRAGSNSIYDLSIAPVSGNTADISVTFNAGFATAGTKTNTVSNTLTIAHSTLIQTTLQGPITHNGEAAFTVEVGFSEVLTGFDTADDITISGGTVSAPTPFGITGRVYMLTITPDGTADITISINSGIAMNSDSNTNAASNMLTVAYTAPADTTPPTVMLTGAPTTVNAGSTTFAVTATFSEAVTGFDEAADITVTNGTAAVPVFVSAGIYTLIITPAGTDGAITITIPADAATDADGNGNTASSAVTVTYDNAPPTATFTGTDSVSNTDEFRGVILTFDKDIFGLGGDDFMVTNGEFVRLEGVTVNRAFELIIKPDGVGDIIITLMAAAVRDLAVGNPNIATSHTVTYAPPVASVHIGNAGRQAGALDEARLTATTKVTVALAPAPTTAVTVNLTRSGTATIDTDYTQTGLAVVGGDPTYSIVVAAGATTTFFTLTTLADTETDPAETAVFTVTTGTDYTVATGGAAAATVTILDDSDTTPPTVTFTAPANHNGTSTFTVTVTLSEPATDFGQDDVALSGNASGTFTDTGSGTDYTLTITPADNNPITIDIAADSFTDAATNANTATSHTVTYAAPADNTPPTVTFTAPVNHNGTSTFTVAVTLSEPATDFGQDDVALSGNASGTFFGGGTDYTLTITPADNNPITIDIAADSFTDAATNGNTAPETLTVTYDAMADTTPPTATFSGVPASHDGMTPFTLTITLSEPSTDFVVGDFFTTINVSLAFSGSGTDYSLTVTPNSIGIVAITINPNVFTDASGNGNIGVDSGFIPYVAPPDTTPPTVELSGAPTTANASDTTFTVTATFSEPVTGFDAMADITVTGGTAIAPVAVGNSETTYTLTITPTTDGTITITIPANVAADAASNDNTASNAVSVTYDSIRPTVVINVATTAITLDTTSPALAIFSESVTGLEASEIQITNGAVRPAGGGAQYILNITPDGSGEDMVITIPEGVVMDAAGNLNTASEPATVLFVAPVVVLSGAPTSVSNTDTFTVTATFTKTVAFSNTAAITIANGSVTNVASSSPVGPVYTLTIAPDGMGDIEITIPAGIVQSADTGTGNIASETLIVTYTPADTTPPTVTFSEVPANHDGTSEFMVTVTLSEPATDFDLSDITFSAASGTLTGSGTDYTLTVTPTDTNSITIDIAAGTFTDAATNGNTASETLTVAYTDTPPLTVVLTSDVISASNNDDTHMLTITFSEDVTGIKTGAGLDSALAVDTYFTFNNAFLSGTVTKVSDSVYRIGFLASGSGDITITFNAGVAMAGSKTNTASNTLTVTYTPPDNTPPTVTFSEVPANHDGTSAFMVTVTLSEPATDFDLSDITFSAASGTLTGSGTDYTLTITPTDTSSVTIDIAADSFTDAATNPNTASETLTVAYAQANITPPTVMLTGAPTTANASDTTFAVTATFSEPVTGFDVAADITVTGGTAIAPVAVGNSGTTYTLTITPTTDGTITITIPANVAVDAESNGNTASNTVSVTYDGTPPTVTFSGAPASHDGMTPFMVTVTLSEPATDFVEDDTSPTNAVRTLSGSGTDYILTITPLNNNPIGIGIFADRFTDAAGNSNAFTNATPIPYAAPADTTPPTVTFSEVPANHDGTSEFMVTVALSEPATDFIAGDITFSDNATGTLTGSGTDYTLTVTPTDNNAITIDIAAGTFTDAATNPNTASETLTVAYAVPDTTPPTVARPVAQFSIVEQATSFEVTVTFSEAVTGFDAATDIMVTRGTTLAPVAMGDSGMVYTLAITPAGPSGQIVITIPAGVAMDASGNLNTASPTLSVTYIRPVTVVLTLAEPQFISNGRDPFAVTATFSEPVNFIMGDVMVANGTFTASGSGAVYTLTITPTGDTNDAITIQLLEGAGEVGASGQILPRDSDASEVLQVMVLLDTTPPTVELTGAPTTANASDTTFAVTATFSEAVTGFDEAADIAVTNGTAAAPVFVSEGIYTLTITPTTDGEITITIPANVAVDAASNNNMASNEVSVTYDGTPPTIALTGSGRTTNTLTFVSTIVSGLVESSDINSASFTLDEFVTSPANVMITSSPSMAGLRIGNVLTITHDGTASEITITVPVGSFTDNAGNPNTEAFTLTFNYVDNTPPTVTFSDFPASHDGTPFTVTVTLSETADDFIAGDIAFSDNATGTLTGSGTDYTLTVTPTDNNAITIDIAAGTFNDAATNPNTASETLTVTYAADNTPPTATFSDFPANHDGTSPFTVTVILSETATDFGVGDVVISDNASGTFFGSGTGYRLTITPTDNNPITIDIAADSFTDAATNGNTAPETLTVAYAQSPATTPLTVVLTVDSTTITDRDFVVTVTTSKILAPFSTDDFSIPNGQVQALGERIDHPDGTAAYPLQIRALSPGIVEVTMMEGFFGPSDGIGPRSTVSNTLVVTYALPSPTVTFSDFPANHDGTSPFTVTVTLSETATDFVVGDIDFSANATGTLTGSGTDYTLTVTPTDTNSITIDIAAGTFTDAATNPNTASETLTVAYAPVDTTPLTVTLSGPLTYGLSGFTTVVRFSEDVPGLTIGAEGYTSFTITNAIVTSFTRRSGSIYDLSIAPVSGGTADISITFNAGAATAGTKTNTVSNTLTIAHSTLIPVSLRGPDSLTHDGETVFTVGVEFTSDVSGFDTAADITISGGTTSAPVASGFGTYASYTLTITPDGTADITISLNSGVAEGDPPDNPTPNAASRVLTVAYAAPADTTAPTVTFTDPPANHSNSEFIVTVTLSEPATDFVVGDIDFSANATGTLTGSGTDYTLAVTPTDTNSITIDIAAGTFTDAATNPNTASETLTVAYAAPADTTAPTVTFTDPPANHSNSEFMVTVTLSEPATDFVVGDIDFSANATGTLTGSGTVYTLTVTPTDTNSITIDIAAGSFTDAATNPNTASETLTVAYAGPADTTAPTVMLSAPDAVNGLDPFAVTATFSEPVTGFDATAITVTNGAVTSVTALVSSSLAQRYTLTITPDGMGDIAIEISAGAVMDAAGNGNTASTNAAGNTPSDPVTVTYDTTAPTVELSGAPDIASSLAPFTVTATFSEAVTFVPGAGIEVTNGAATLSGSGANYTLTITPDGTGDMSITFPADVAMDAAGNGNEASDTVSVAHDATAPTVTLTGPDTLSNLAPFEVTATFSEGVTGLEVAEIVVTNGAVTTLSGSGANYVLTMTPTGNGDLSITIPRDVAVDAAANGNTASSTLAVVNTIVADTKAAITGFMLDRADKLARNQPGLTRFLQGTGCRGGLSASSTDVSGSVAGCMSSGHTWGEISNTWSSDSTYTLATVGVHGFMRDNLIIGGQVQFDSVDDDRRNITGRGWLVGPYFVHQLTDQNMSFEGRLLTGRTDNDISPLGSYEDSFGTERSLAQLRITGRYRYPTVTLMPLLDFTYTEDTQKAYTDTLGNLIDEQGVDLTQLTFGMDFSLPVAVQTGQLDLKGGLSGTYSEVNGGQSDVEGGRGRAELGLNYSRDNGTTLGAGVFYDGIGSDHESFGANLSFDMKF